jgi:DNA-binding NarL/FixJ family response regulator
MNADGQKCRVLVIEDEALVAMLIEDMIHDSGDEMVGSACRLSDALLLAQETQADVALLDINLGGALAYPVADVLRQRGVPIVFTSGYGSAGLIERFQDCPILDKPFDQHSLEKAIHAILSSNACSSDLAA